MDEQQMKIAQLTARGLILQLKEEEAWNRYCQNHLNKEHILSNRSQPPHGKTVVHASQSRIVSLPRSSEIKQSLHAEQEAATGDFLELKNMKSFDKHYATSKDLQSIRTKLDSLQKEIAMIPKMSKTSRDPHLESLVNHHDTNKALVKVLSLRSSLEHGIARIEDEKNQVIERMKQDYHFSKRIMSNGIGFQVPYILKEEIAIAKRANKNAVPRSIPVRRKKAVGFRPTSVSSRPIEPKSQKFLNDTAGEKGDIDSLVEDMMDDLLDDSLPHVRKAQNLKEKFISKNINALAERIKKIEKIGDDIRDRWRHRLLKPGSSVSSPYHIGAALPNASGDSVVAAPMPNVLFSEKSPGNVEEVDSENCNSCQSDTVMLYISATAVRDISENRKNFKHFVRMRHGRVHRSIDCIVESFFESLLEAIVAEIQAIPQSIVLDMYNGEFALS